MSLGSEHADCPILFIITIPKFITLGHSFLSDMSLVEKALRGFPNNKKCRIPDDNKSVTLAASQIIKGDDCEDANGFPQ
jgi:hypothetical protein